MLDRQSDGARRMAAFMRERGITQLAASKHLMVSDPTIHDWVSGGKRPRPHHRRAIEIWSSGAVPAMSWETAEEIAGVEAVRPFEAPVPAEEEEAPKSDRRASERPPAAAPADEVKSCGPSSAGEIRNSARVTRATGTEG